MRLRWSTSIGCSMDSTISIRSSRALRPSDCAYWMLVDTSTAGGSIAVSRLTSEWFYSKQTINSAIKSLDGAGLRNVGVLPKAVVRTRL